MIYRGAPAGRGRSRRRPRFRNKPNSNSNSNSYIVIVIVIVLLNTINTDSRGRRHPRFSLVKTTDRSNDKQNKHRYANSLNKLCVYIYI